MKSYPVILTVAGSDSGGGAGIQADLKTVTVLGGFGVSALTCVTAQNPAAVTAIEALPIPLVVEQIRTVCGAFPVAAAKTGMLFSAELIRAVAGALDEARTPNLVVDPVMVASSGARLLREDAVTALQEILIPRARVITPNLHEAEILWGRSIPDLDAMREAAGGIAARFGVACFLKGGHLTGDTVYDLLAERGALVELKSRRMTVYETHGAGCTLSAALATFLGRGASLESAARDAKAFVAAAFEHAFSSGHHYPLNLLEAGGRWDER